MERRLASTEKQLKENGKASGREPASAKKKKQSTPAKTSDEESADEELILPSMQAIKENEKIEKQVDERL